MVWVGDGEISASVIAGSLEADGIRAVVEGFRPLPYSGMAAFGGGSWRVLVPGTRAEAARALLRESGEDSGIVDAGDEPDGHRTATLKFAAVGVLVVAALLLFFALGNAIGGG